MKMQELKRANGSLLVGVNLNPDASLERTVPAPSACDSGGDGGGDGSGWFGIGSVRVQSASRHGYHLL